MYRGRNNINALAYIKNIERQDLHMARIRTIQSTLNLIKLQDPETAVTEYMLRQMIISGDIPSFQSGSKYLVDVDVVLKILYGDN